MVDAAPTVTVEAVAAGSLRTYAAFARGLPTAPAQHPLWVAAWAAQQGSDCLIASLNRAGRRVLALPLEVVREGRLGIARPIGGSHANGNFPVVTSDFSAAGTAKGEIEALLAALARARPDIDLLALDRQARALEGNPNPLAALFPSYESPNVALAVDLAGGFEAVLQRRSGQRKCKKHRSQIRKFEAAGGFRCFRAATSEAVKALLAAFFAMKQRRFTAMGVRDVFADAATRLALEALFTGALAEDDPPFFLQGLEVGGRLRAVAGLSRCGSRLICEFGAIAEDELVHASPGDFLFFEMIGQACADGFAVFDFSVGDEPYKRLWCDIETRQCDTLMPLTAKGRVGAVLQRLDRRARRAVKQSAAGDRLLRALRRRTASAASD